VLLENGIDTTVFCPRLSRAEAKQGLGIPPERLVIGAVGRLSPEKGFDLLIHAVDQLLHAGHDVELLIAGEGSERTALQALVSKLGRQERIWLLGYVADVRDLYEAVDVFALSSYREGLPNVVLEALAMEVPVVATSVAGVPHLIRHGENGLLVELGQCESLTAALASVLADAELRSRLASAGRSTVEMGYSFSARMERLRTWYDALLHKIRPPVAAGELCPRRISS
jgi:glycosyltransferase involved in cell wall biosynthesis